MVHRDSRYLCQKWRRYGIQLQEVTQLQEPTEDAKCADVQEPYLEGTLQACERALGDHKKKGFHKYNHRLDSWIE